MKKKATLEQAWIGKMRAGAKYFDQGQPDKATNSFRKATKLCPQRVESWINLGSALLESQRYEQSVVAVKKALSLQPELMLSHLILGDSLRMLGQWDDAINSYQTAVDLERTPVSLNKLACALRSQGNYQFAERLLREAIGMNPSFTIARVNLATLQITLNRFEDAEARLKEVAGLLLAPVEKKEIESAQLALSEHARLKGAITELTEKGALDPLETLLRSIPAEKLQVDENTLSAIGRYTDSASRLTFASSPINNKVPDEWPLIEAMFMIPHVNSVSEYLAVKGSLQHGLLLAGDLLESTNMEAVILAARSTQHELQDPIKAELHLRHWHALACQNLNDFMPGHFKYTQNWSPSNPSLQRVDPAQASGTFRRFIDEFYQHAPPGLARAALVAMAVCDLHAFADGNGRLGITWLNRELEWAGLAPALFSRELGIRGKLGAARKEVRSNRGNLESLVAVINEAQQFGRFFCSQLAEIQEQ
ncbi:MAG: tetratricopeptide repeat protein [Halioglobus sp.]|nr:tetratricopeptide repeat protein [Halioglobus sp.]